MAIRKAFIGLLFFSILTLWVDRYWPVAVFALGTYLLAGLEVLGHFRKFRLPVRDHMEMAAFVLLGAVAAWPAVQTLMGTTVYGEPTRTASLGLLAVFCSVYLLAGVPTFEVRWTRNALLYFAFGVSVVAIVQHATANGKVFWFFENANTGLPSVMGPIIYHSHWAAFVEAVLPVALYNAVRRRGSWWLNGLMVATLYASVVASSSRMGLLICTAELIAVATLVYLREPEAAWTRALIPVGGAVALLTAIVGPGKIAGRLLESDPYFGRREVIAPSFAMLRGHELAGIGLGNWPVVYPQFATFDQGLYMNQAHNDWLQWAVEGGVPYAIVMLLLAAIACRQAWRFPWAAGLPAVFCHAFTDYPFSRPALSAWIFSMFALSIAAGAKGRPRQRARTNGASDWLGRADVKAALVGRASARIAVPRDEFPRGLVAHSRFGHGSGGTSVPPARFNNRAGGNSSVSQGQPGRVRLTDMLPKTPLKAVVDFASRAARRWLPLRPGGIEVPCGLKSALQRVGPALLFASRAARRCLPLRPGGDESPRGLKSALHSSRQTSFPWTYTD